MTKLHLGAFCALLAGCAASLPEPEQPAHICEAAQTLTAAQSDLASVLAYVERAQAEVDATQALLESIAAARASFGAGDYSSAIAEASLALQQLEALEHRVPKRMSVLLEQAADLLTMAGK